MTFESHSLVSMMTNVSKMRTGMGFQMTRLTGSAAATVGVPGQWPLPGPGWGRRLHYPTGPSPAGLRPGPRRRPARADSDGVRVGSARHE